MGPWRLMASAGHGSADHLNDPADARPVRSDGRARAGFLNVSTQKKPRRREIKSAIHRQPDYLQLNLDAIDALITSGAMLSGFKPHWWYKLLVISELYREQCILLYSKTRSMPDRIVNLVQRHVRPMVRGRARATALLSCRGSAGFGTTNPKT